MYPPKRSVTGQSNTRRSRSRASSQSRAVHRKAPQQSSPARNIVSLCRATGNNIVNTIEDAHQIATSSEWHYRKQFAPCQRNNRSLGNFQPEGATAFSGRPGSENSNSFLASHDNFFECQYLTRNGYPGANGPPGVRPRVSEESASRKRAEDQVAALIAATRAVHNSNTLISDQSPVLLTGQQQYRKPNSNSDRFNPAADSRDSGSTGENASDNYGNNPQKCRNGAQNSSATASQTDSQRDQEPVKDELKNGHVVSNERIDREGSKGSKSSEKEDPVQSYVRSERGDVVEVADRLSNSTRDVGAFSGANSEHRKLVAANLYVDQLNQLNPNFTLGNPHARPSSLEPGLYNSAMQSAMQNPSMQVPFGFYHDPASGVTGNAARVQTTNLAGMEGMQDGVLNDAKKILQQVSAKANSYNPNYRVGNQSLEGPNQMYDDITPGVRHAGNNYVPSNRGMLTTSYSGQSLRAPRTLLPKNGDYSSKTIKQYIRDKNELLKEVVDLKFVNEELSKQLAITLRDKQEGHDFLHVQKNELCYWQQKAEDLTQQKNMMEKDNAALLNLQIEQKAHIERVEQENKHLESKNHEYVETLRTIERHNEQHKKYMELQREKFEIDDKYEHAESERLRLKQKLNTNGEKLHVAERTARTMSEQVRLLEKEKMKLQKEVVSRRDDVEEMDQLYREKDSIYRTQLGTKISQLDAIKQEYRSFKRRLHEYIIRSRRVSSNPVITLQTIEDMCQLDDEIHDDLEQMRNENDIPANSPMTDNSPIFPPDHNHVVENVKQYEDDLHMLAKSAAKEEERSREEGSLALEEAARVT